MQRAPGWLPLLSVGEHLLPPRGASCHADGVADPVSQEALHQLPAVAASGAQCPDYTALSAAAWAHLDLAVLRVGTSGSGVLRADTLLLVQESGFWLGDFPQHHPSIPALACLLRTEEWEELGFLAVTYGLLLPSKEAES